MSSNLPEKLFPTSRDTAVAEDCPKSPRKTRWFWEMCLSTARLCSHGICSWSVEYLFRFPGEVVHILIWNPELRSRQLSCRKKQLRTLLGNDKDVASEDLRKNHQSVSSHALTHTSGLVPPLQQRSTNKSSCLEKDRSIYIYIYVDVFIRFHKYIS